MTDKPKLTANQMLERKLRETREASERYRREHAMDGNEEEASSETATERSPQTAPSAEADEESKVRVWEEQMRQYADQNGGIVPPKPSPKPFPTRRHVRLPVPAREPAASARDAAPPDTETLLNGLIEECRFLMREVAFHSMRLTSDVDDRLRFMSAAESMAMTGAKVGESVAKLRGGTTVVEERRQHMLVEHVQRVVATQPIPEGEGVGA